MQIATPLLTDCHHLGALSASQLLLHRNATMPWFIVVPKTELQDVLDLPGEQLQAVMNDCVGVSSFVKNDLGYSKVNFAGLGNLVPQMHLHIIGRRPDDACWPQPVWGNLSASAEYSDGQLRQWQSKLCEVAGLVVGD